jgi:hypothetical protein
MNIKKCKFAIIILSLNISQIAYSQNDEINVIKEISQFKEKINSDDLINFFNRIEKNTSFDQNNKADFFVQILAITNKYLKDKPEPIEIPQLNIAPPDGSIAGIDPVSIKDPIARAQYEKDIMSNAVLAEAHRKHKAISTIHNRLISYCDKFSKVNLQNKNFILDVIKKLSSNQEEAKELQKLIEK